MIPMTTTEHKPELHIVERTDEQGRYCLVYQDDTPEGQEATYASLEEAGQVVAGLERKGEFYALTVHGDADEWNRFNRALWAARDEYSRMERISRAPRDKQTGRPLFVRLGR